MINPKNNPELEIEDIKIKFLTRKKKAALISSIILLALLIGGYTVWEYAYSQNRIILATTTSTYDSGLLDYLLPPFEKKYGIYVDVLSLGTGQALEAGEKGDADVLLVHARSQEDDFIEDGYGKHRVCVMYNDFFIVGPSSDPANIKEENITKAMEKLKNAGENKNVEFYSRGDNSGTHIKELELWKLINFKPDTAIHKWYIETGSGMGDTLTTANNEEAYTLVDRGTWFSLESNLKLVVLVKGDEILLNPYGAMAVNPETNSNIKYDYAIALIAFLVSEEGQELIGSFKINGEKLFKPCFGKCNEKYGCETTGEELEYWKDHNGGYEG